MTREEWGARPVENITLRTSWPIMTMVLDMSCMSVNIDRCYNKEDCILRVRDLQRYYMDVIGLPDIPYKSVAWSEYKLRFFCGLKVTIL